MAHNSQFHPQHEPFRDNDDLQIQHSRIHGPFSFLNPTRAEFKHSGVPQKSSPRTSAESASEEEKQYPSNTPASHISFLWRSRDNRKGRHALLIDPADKEEDAKYLTPEMTNTLRAIARNVLRMFTYFPVWDISYVIAVLFTVGSTVWVINAFFSWLPLVQPGTAFNGELLYGGGITSFIGAVIFFETGSILLLFEAVNENATGCFGWAIEGLFDDENANGNGAKGPTVKIRPERQHCHHHHQNKRNFVGTSSSNTAAEHKPADEKTKDGKTWQWWPSGHALRTHYFHEIGFLAGFSQFLGATIFSIAGFTALPGINNHLSTAALNGAFWFPQVLGAVGFVVSGLLYMLETQRRWYIPAPRVLGWWIGFFNEIGAWGFLLCGALGFASGSTKAVYESSLATFWGSWAFEIASVLQLYESLNKFSVEQVQKGPKKS